MYSKHWNLQEIKTERFWQSAHPQKYKAGSKYNQWQISFAILQNESEIAMIKTQPLIPTHGILTV